MGQGELLAPIRFSSDVCRQLTKVLTKHDSVSPRALGSAHDVMVVIAQLEQVAAVVPALRKPDVRAAQRALKARAAAVRELLRDDNQVDALLAGELARQGWEPARFLNRLREGVGEIDKALKAIAARMAERDGERRPTATPGRLVYQTAHVLAQAGVPVTQYGDGTLAKVLQILWPAVLKRQAPVEFRPWLKLAKSRR
jgi:hypothetical protein